MVLFRKYSTGREKHSCHKYIKCIKSFPGMFVSLRSWKASTLERENAKL